MRSDPNSRISNLIGFLRDTMGAVTGLTRRPSLTSGNGIRSGVVCLVLVAIFMGQVLSATAQETDRERQDRLNREDQMRRDNEAYMERWRERQSTEYAAIAYSKSTDKLGYSWAHGSLGDASRAALSQCKAEDAEIVCWAKNGWYCAFADGPKSYGTGSGPTADEAKAKALKKANDRNPGCRIRVCIGGTPQKVERPSTK